MKKVLAAIKSFVAKDLLWKIFSLAAAVALWFIVMNTLNPTETKSFTTDLTFINESVLSDNQLVVINKKDIENTKVTIRVNGTRAALDELSKTKNKAEIKAYIDLKQLDGVIIEKGPQELNLRITPKLPDNILMYSYEIAGWTPNAADAKGDNLKSETMKLQINMIGQLKSGYNAGKPVCETDTVRITGPESMFDKVAAVKASVDISGKTGDISVTAAPAVYDTEGVPMELFTVDPAVIDVSVGIDKQWQIPVKAPNVIGELNENLVLESVEYEPKSIEVEGSIEDINKVEVIQLPDVDLGAIEHTQTFTYDIRPSLKGTDLQLKEGAPTEAKVTITVKAKASRDITLTAEDFAVTGPSEGLSADIRNVNLTVYGSQEAVDALTVQALGAKIDLTGLTPGWHSIDFTLTLPENVEVRTMPSANVVIRAKEENIPETTVTTTAAASEPETEEITEEETAEETTAPTEEAEESTKEE